ncbi:putative cytochrome P450 [Helianthus annuus]|uniref:Cytochrome P450 n=1 Tax=Helianthus annuus TaxID=4232 RepID=A0A9K3IHZ8_HELAN|nr:beta-amyrin 28-monooxygenase-like [Helianthus annuus]KAF5797381.1 putative cytochrome P450 [Helianthus annuus]KAJ0549135.1 putative cytochrome P450 [Helianthus annuus]KAJ0555382.1 putative cytochrome P450 [Helianthus annuus]KAJ0555421.1 putative cytochrome P450 [Helianthus annuus]KAJ0562085.1 putative cytochrome P450 [Helianthus annuus]
MVTTLLALFFLFIVLCFFLQTHRKKLATSNNLPPGSFGWPFLGETLEFIRSQTDGTPERFVRERVERYGSPLVFKTSLLGHPTAIFSGPEGNKFLFGNENKLVAMWLPEAVGRLFGNRCLNTTRGDEAKWLRKTMLPCLGPDALSNRYCIAMDEVTRLHIQSQWEGRSEVTVFDTVKPYLFELACRLFLNLDDPRRVTELGSLFNTFLKGLGSLPIDIPGTQFYRGKRAAIAIKKQLIMIINQRKLTLKQENASSFEDLLSHLLLNSDENGQFLSEMEIANNILLLLFAGHDTSAVSITLLMKCLGEHPDVYKNVLKEQLGILEGKAPGEVLNWEDIQKMRYSWNVVCEVLRLNPPVIGSFREALVDFEYAGYTIPKGWKIMWSAPTTQKEEDNFPNVTKFDPSRFEGTGPTPFTYIPFGGGPRMCLGKEVARVQILVFLHNIVTKFKWDLLIPDEKIEYVPLATPVKGLPIRLHPHQV